MKKKFLNLMFLSGLVLALGACGPTGDPSSTPIDGSSEPGSSEPAEVYTVGFNVDGERYYTAMVEEGQTITDTVPDPYKEGHEFTGWYEGSTLVDLETYIVTKSTIFDAGFAEVEEDDALSVTDVKEEGKEYYMVLGWWEVKDPAEPDKVTSGLKVPDVRLFYANLIKYLTAKGATADDIANISFRDYSSATVAEMGTMVNTDADVDLLIGVGANVFTTAGVLPYNTSDDSKFKTTMGTAGKERYVALVQGASELAKETFDWLDSEVGHKTFIEDVPQDVINSSLGGDVINLSVTVHGDTDVTTLLDDKDDVVEMPTITVETGYSFDGFAISAEGEVVLDVEKDAELKWEDLKDLANGATTLDLYPVISLIPVAEADLVVYVQVNGSNLTMPEAKLLLDRYESTLTEDIEIEYNIVEGNADTFAAAVSTNADVIIGGNSPVKNYKTHADGAITNAAAGHFASTNRKVIITETVNADHLDAAKDFYAFVTTEAPTFTIHSTFWHKEYTWVTADEMATIKSGMEMAVATLFSLDNVDTLKATYNLEFDYYEAVNTTVAELGAETLALNDGEGTDLIIGCGANVTSKGLVEVVEKKEVSKDQMAAGRYVALVHEKSIARAIYETYFIALA